MNYLHTTSFMGLSRVVVTCVLGALAPSVHGTSSTQASWTNSEGLYGALGVQPLTSTRITDGALSLDALAEEAASTHASVTASRAAVNAADAEQDGAWQQFLPTPSLQVEQGHSGEQTTKASLSQPLWAGGRLTAGLDAAKARAQSARYSVGEARQDLAFSVAAAYQNFVQARGRQQVLERLLARLDGYQQSMQRRVEGGASPSSDLELVRSRRSGARAELISTKAAEDAALAQLSQLVGRRLTRADVQIEHSGSMPAGLEDVVALAEDFSPTLRRLSRDIEATRGDAAVSKAAIYPTLSLVAQNEQAQSNLGHNSDNAVMLQLQFTPGAGLSSLSRANSAQARVEVAQANREAALTDLESRVRSEYENLRSAMESKPDIEANAKAAGNVLGSYERLFNTGKRSWLDMLNAARELSFAEIAVMDLTAQRVTSRYRLALYCGEPLWMTHAND
ncbi:TolC family protein [Pseudomonas baetica]|uniref:TolC family protein n=1 Tax=Pseudomonas baetica TaxID=674054 RepID=UPI003EEF9741